MSADRRLAFYKHLASYILANEVDKFLSVKFGKPDDADAQLEIATVDGTLIILCLFFDFSIFRFLTPS